MHIWVFFGSGVELSKYFSQTLYFVDHMSYFVVSVIQLTWAICKKSSKNTKCKSEKLFCTSLRRNI